MNAPVIDPKEVAAASVGVDDLGTEPVPMTTNALDTLIYVAIAGVGSALAVHVWDWRAALGVTMACLVAWKAKRSKGRDQAKTEEDSGS